MKNYDSKKDTEKHIKRVGFYLKKCRVEIAKRAKQHDYDKIHNEVEKKLFDEYTPKLRNCTSRTKGGKMNKKQKAEKVS